MKPFLALSALAAALTAYAATYNFAPPRTTVEYSVDSTLHTVHGEFALKRGKLHIDAANGQAQGELVVDAASGQSGNSERDARMAREILETAKYPEIVFQPDRIEGRLAAEGASHVKLHGVMAIHGAQHEIAADVDARAIPGGFDATAHFAIPYVAWGMKNPSNFILKVSKVVNVTLHTTAETDPRD
jgi:polyisoprenoid-binding protein YceI